MRDPGTQGPPDGVPVYTVAEFTAGFAKHIRGFPGFWLEGEVTARKPSGNGGWRCTLRDETGASAPAYLPPAVMARARFDPSDGLVIRGPVRLQYWMDGARISVVFDSVQPRDEGSLQLAFRQLQERLEREGLFSSSRKRPIPRFPRVVGIVTSKQGAVFQDIRVTVQARMPAMELHLFPVPVQGERAAEEIVRAIGAFNRAGRAEVLLVGRGGGSTEDLWAFNDERVVRAIAGSQIPVISCVGHETDVTLADLAADLRVATPTAAAQAVTPVTFDQLQASVDQFERRVGTALRRRVDGPRGQVAALLRRRVFTDPGLLTRAARDDLATVADDLEAALRDLLDATRARAETARLRLHGANPLALLERGFAVVERADDASVIREPAQVSAGDRIRVRVHGGQFEGEVT